MTGPEHAGRCTELQWADVPALNDSTDPGLTRECHNRASAALAGGAVATALAVLTAILTAGPLAAQATESFVAAHGALVPATYTAQTPEGGVHLDLWPEQAFHLTRTSADGTAGDAFAGRWRATGNSLVLDLGGEDLILDVRNSGRLRPPGAPEDASGDLVAEGSLAPAPIRLMAEGMFTYFADAPTFVHCATGRLYPVLQVGDYLALEGAYLEDREAPGAPLFVTLEATFAVRTQMEGPDRLSVEVERFDATWPGQACAATRPAPALSETVWRPVRIAGARLDWTPPAREPFLIVDADAARFNASVGCNTLLGQFRIPAADNSVAFGPVAGTLMACPDDLAQAEASFIDALEATISFQIAGGTLRLTDADGRVTAELRAVYAQ